jgi:hypothetical protein
MTDCLKYNPQSRPAVEMLFKSFCVTSGNAMHIRRSPKTGVLSFKLMFCKGLDSSLHMSFYGVFTDRHLTENRVLNEKFPNPRIILCKLHVQTHISKMVRGVCGLVFPANDGGRCTCRQHAQRWGSRRLGICGRWW